MTGQPALLCPRSKTTRTATGQQAMITNDMNALLCFVTLFYRHRSCQVISVYLGELLCGTIAQLHLCTQAYAAGMQLPGRDRRVPSLL